MQALEARMTMILIEIAAASKIIIRNKLKSTLGDKAKHFTVVTSTSVDQLFIEVRPNDEVGVFIQSGTKPHMITSTSPMSIGGGKFSMYVNHPGTKEYGSQIEKIAIESVNEAIALAMMSI